MRAAWLFIGVAACATDPADCEAQAPARTWACGSPWSIELGLGETAWTPLGDAALLPLVRGTQGLQHVDLAARLDLDPADLPIDRATVTLGAWALPDGEMVVPEDTWGTAIHLDTDAPTLVGLRMVVADPDRFVGQRVGIGLAVTPVGYGSTGTGWIEGELGWAEEGD